MPARFIGYRQFNAPELSTWANSRRRLHPPSAAGPFPSDKLPDRLARSLATRRAINLKELLESFEMFERVRRRVRAKHLADVCCGHGLTGLLFAIFEREVESVLLLDKTRPPAFDAVFASALEVAPWVAGKVRYVEDRVEDAAAHLPQGASVVAVHACGKRTDAALTLAMQLRGAVAVMPCCYFRTADPAPATISGALGKGLASDIDRTYRLEAAGYRVSWTEIPAAITPLGRVLVGVPAGDP